MGRVSRAPLGQRVHQTDAFGIVCPMGRHHHPYLLITFPRPASADTPTLRLLGLRCHPPEDPAPKASPHWTCPWRTHASRRAKRSLIPRCCCHPAPAHSAHHECAARSCLNMRYCCCHPMARRPANHPTPGLSTQCQTGWPRVSSEACGPARRSGCGHW